GHRRPAEGAGLVLYEESARAVHRRRGSPPHRRVYCRQVAGQRMHADETVKKPSSLSDWARQRFKGTLQPVAAALLRLGLTPNAVTLLGLAGNIVAAGLLALGYMTLGGIVIVLMAPLDALDGTMARLIGQPSKLGAFVDSVTDRWSELFIFMGLLYFYV